MINTGQTGLSAQSWADWLETNDDSLLSELQQEFSKSTGVPWHCSPLWAAAFKLYQEL